MAETLSSLFVTEKNKLHSTSGWILLFEAVIDASTSLRICDDQANFTWNSKTYYSFPLSVEPIRSESDGNLESVSVVISNITRELATEIENLNFIDSRAWVRLVHRTSSSLSDVVEWQFQTQQIRTTQQDIRFQLGHIDLMNKPFPLNTFSRNRCRWVYKSSACGYTLGIATCDLTLDGDNGCRIHGDDEVANGQTRMHPNRFGGFPGIPKLHT